MEKESASFWAGIKKFEDILASNPKAYSFAPLAEIYRKLGLPDEALRIAKQGVALHPEFAAGQMALATSCLDKNMVEEARQALEAVVRITPENLDAQRLLAGIYQAAGNTAAATACLRIVAEFEPDSAEGAAGMAVPSSPAEVAGEAQPVVPMAAAVEAPSATEEEEILEADILELTDDLIEEDAFGEESFSPFAAAPPRPSLEAEKTVAPPAAPQPVAPVTAPQEEAAQPPVLTATIAELYVTQGFIDKGVDVYRELLRDNPDNGAYRSRYLELTGGAPAVVPAADEAAPPALQAVEGAVAEPVQGGQAQVSQLEGWLANIRRIKECRTETL